ncbi:MAG: alpha/beta hydrolase [Synergistaceae bacterium]|nr:alpha/beta hydrolase [Synergistaceae bacterium]
MCTRNVILALLVLFGTVGGAFALETVNENTKIADVVNNPAFGDWGQLLFPVNKNYYSGSTLGELRLTWYSNINPARTADVVRYMLRETEAGRQVFYRIYPHDDPRARDTGLFFFRGKSGAKFAVCSAGGGFVFVGAMHDSFPHAMELSRLGYNAFALIYRPGADTACEDLARAIAFIHDNAGSLGVDVNGYSLWGGSAGARMAAWLGAHGTESFGEKKYPRPSAVIMQYTALNEVTGNEPATYACVGTDDGIAPYSVMERRIRAIRANGTDAMIEVFPGLGHGFGLGECTIAEGWLNNAVHFWEQHM